MAARDAVRSVPSLIPIFRRVGKLRSSDMVNDVIPVTATAAGTFAELGGRAANGSAEHRPTGPHKRRQACGPGRVERLPLSRRDDRRGTHVGGHVAQRAFHHVELGDLVGEQQTCNGDHFGVTPGVAGQRLQCLLLGAARAAPPWPVER